MTVSVVENPSGGRVPAAGPAFDPHLLELDLTPYAPSLSGSFCSFNTLSFTELRANARNEHWRII